MLYFQDSQTSVFWQW